MTRRSNKQVTIEDLIRELGTRPAMNGGFARLAEQQDELCAQGIELTRRLNSVESWQIRFDKRFAWLAGAVGTAVISTLVREGYNLLVRLAVIH